MYEVDIQQVHFSERLGGVVSWSFVSTVLGGCSANKKKFHVAGYTPIQWYNPPHTKDRLTMLPAT